MTGKEFFELLLKRSLGVESLSEEQANSIASPSYDQIQIPDSLQTQILGGLYNKSTAINSPDIQNEIRGRMYGFVDDKLKPLFADMYGWTEEEYNKQAKAKNGNTLELLRKFSKEHASLINNKVEDAVKTREGADAQKLREELESEFGAKLKAANSTIEEVRASYKTLQAEKDEREKFWEAHVKDRDITQYINHKLSGYKIREDLLKPPAEGLPSYWDSQRQTMVNEIKTSFAWVQDENGNFNPMDKSNPDSYAVDDKMNKLDANAILNRRLAPLLAKTEKKTPPKVNPMRRIQNPPNPVRPNVGSKNGQAKAPRL